MFIALRFLVNPSADCALILILVFNTNIVGSGPDWLFDIDALTRTINYEPVVVGTQSNGLAGTKASDNARQARKETQPIKDYILLPLWIADLSFSQDPKSSQDDEFRPSSVDGTKVDEDSRKEIECNDQEKEHKVNNTNNVNIVSSTVNAASINEDNELPFDLNMHALEDVSIFNFLNNDEDDDIVADTNNMNKKDERGIVIRNKVRLVAQGHTQEEGIDYDEVFAPVARIEAVRLFLAYASFKDVVVYQMDVKSDFLYGKIEEEVYVCQPPGFEDPDFPGRVYKVEKALCGLHQAPRAWFIEVKNASKPMETQNPLLKDKDGKEVDVYMYRYQVNSKVSHLHAVKRIFRYLKGHLKLGLWYPKDSPFDLVAYTNSDYVGASLDRKSTTGGSVKKSVRLMMEQLFEMELELILLVIKKRRKFFAAKRPEEKRNKPPTQAQQRKIMCTYLKNMEGKKLKDLKNKSFDSIQKMFDRAFKRNMEGKKLKDLKNKSFDSIQKMFDRAFKRYEVNAAEELQLLEQIQAFEATDDSPVVPEHTAVETPMNMSPENKAHFLAEKEAIHLILTGIRYDIYSTVDACQTAHEIWEAIERNIKMNANPLALVATAQANRDQYYQTSRSHRSSTPSPKSSIPSRSHMTTRHKGNEIAKPITPPSEIAFEEDSDPEQAQRDKDMQKNLAFIAKYFKKIYKPTNNNLRTSLNSKDKNVDMTPRYKNDDHFGQFRNHRMVNVAAARENVGSKVVQQSGIQCFNCKEYRHFAKECRKPKRVKDSAYHKDKMLLCKQAEQGVSLQAEQYDWLANTDEEVDEQELEAHYSYMAKIQEKANTTLAQELKECKTILVGTSKSLGESISVRDSFLVALQTKQAEFEKYKAFNDRTIDYDKLECKFNEALGQLAHKDTIIREDVLAELQCMYLYKVKECDCLAQKLSKQTESVSKKVYTELLQRFAKLEKHSISLEIALQKCKEQIVQLIIFIVNSGCTKHITGNLKLLCSFVEKFMGTVHFGNDQFAPILGYGDLVQGNVMINRVYYVEGLNHNLFLVGQFYDTDLEVAFRKSTCYVRDLQGNDLLVAKRSSFKSKAVLGSKGRLNLLHMDLCGPMRVASINRKKYILVIVDDYSRYTWTLFLCSKDETPKVLKDFLMMIQRNLQALVITVHTDRGTEFLNKTLNAFFKEEGIEHQISTARTPKQNDVVDRWNHTLVESKGYRVYNKRTRMIVESIHICFNEIKEVSETYVGNNTSGLVPQRQKASDYDNPDPVPQRQDVFSSADTDVPSQQELDLLFGPLYDDFFNGGSNPSTNIQSTSAPSTLTNMCVEENYNDQAEEGEHVQDDEFANHFCALTQEVAESSSHNIEQVHGNPSRPVQTRRQLATHLKMCLYALTVSTAKPKNIKEAMAYFAWIEAMQEELHQFDSDSRFRN
nr:retrovirus-related Pol polyprotein from transposon TNT 1-94 [Tanacetum cinerariifolium]